ncbi:MAG: hypothetical protein IIA41_13290 [SAR324 cluster bacterium]|nr:hypothetical protein [SAR324 cluster bacterium]
MAFGKLRGRADPKPAPSSGGAGTDSSGLAAQLRQGIKLPPDRLGMLKEGYQKGLEFFETFNESRLKLAFTSFDEDMRKALFEVLFLLHVNDPSFAQLKFTGTKRERVRGIQKEVPFEATADLYVEGAPHGVQGIDQVSAVFRDQFEAYIKEVFGMPIVGQSTYGYCPITSIHSLGSIGTVGHKSLASDLDLQVQYDLEPFLFDGSGWNDDTFKQAMRKEQEFIVHRLRAQQQLPASALQDPKVKETLLGKARAALRMLQCARCC